MVGMGWTDPNGPTAPSSFYGVTVVNSGSDCTSATHSFTAPRTKVPVQTKYVQVPVAVPDYRSRREAALARETMFKMKMEMLELKQRLEELEDIEEEFRRRGHRIQELAQQVRELSAGRSQPGGLIVSREGGTEARVRKLEFE